MSKIRRTFTVEDKLRILSESDQHGVEQTLRKHNLARSLFYRWKHQFDLRGSDGLARKYHKVDPIQRKLEKENEQLRKIIAKQALELEVKEELLKKTSTR